MLVDNVTLTIKAGDGGNGASTFLSNRHNPKGGPDGGNGGNGGNIYFQGSNNINDLREFRYKKKITAEDGIAGQRKNLFGANAPHTTIYVPIGTQITDEATGKEVEITNTTSLVLLAHGGKGGRGNHEFKSATNQAPRFAEKGTAGEEKVLHLELRLIAEVGLIGLPNSGKSSLLAQLTNADPKIGDYPFTTIEPNIGMLGEYAIADIPGLIEGASKGKGLGIKFLKHIEKTRILLHCLDVSGDHLEETYEIVRNEFKDYSEELYKKQEIILLTKIDLADEEKINESKKLFERKNMEVLTCSIYQPETIQKLKERIAALLQ